MLLRNHNRTSPYRAWLRPLELSPLELLIFIINYQAVLLAPSPFLSLSHLPFSSLSAYSVRQSKPRGTLSCFLKTFTNVVISWQGLNIIRAVWGSSHPSLPGRSDHHMAHCFGLGGTWLVSGDHVTWTLAPDWFRHITWAHGALLRSRVLMLSLCFPPSCWYQQQWKFSVCKIRAEKRRRIGGNHPTRRTQATQNEAFNHRLPGNEKKWIFFRVKLIRPVNIENLRKATECQFGENIHFSLFWKDFTEHSSIFSSFHEFLAQQSPATASSL